ncbi:hypothetical protein B0H12DRAFT_1156815, partial [Mycena haematopus]
MMHPFALAQQKSQQCSTSSSMSSSPRPNHQMSPSIPSSGRLIVWPSTSAAGHHQRGRPP